MMSKLLIFARYTVHRALVAICLALPVCNLSAQNQECGTPDIPLAQMEQILANLPNLPIVAGAAPIRIPIWFFQVRRTDGSTNFPGYEIEMQMAELNQYFDGIFEFSVCGSDVINNDDFYDLNLETDTAGLHGFVNSMFQPVLNHCIKVFLVHGIINGNDIPSGYTHNRLQFNQNAAVYYANGSTNTLAHEMGHYFGLPHTFLDPSTQYVHDLAHPVLINGILTTCYHTGDGFCDTPAEIQYAACPPNNLGTDPLGVPYHPDPSLLMGYSDCRNRFTGDQTIRMLTLYNLDDNYAALKDMPAECAIKTGKILNHCLVGNNQFPDPFDELKVIVKESNQNCQDFTDDAGNYEIKPSSSCNLGNSQRSILPDLNFSNPLNGVTTYDLVLMSKHVLSIEVLDSPFKIIAADVNNSGSVTSFDIVTTRRVILGIDSTFPNKRNWRFIPKLCTGNQNFRDQFEDGNPFDAQFDDPFGGWPRTYLCPPGQPAIPNNCTWMDHVSVIPTAPLAQLQNTWSLTGIKVGDLNCGAISNGLAEPPPSEEGFDSETGFPIAIGQGAFKKIQVIAHTSQEVVAWQFGATFPATSLHIGSFLTGNTASTFDPANLHFINGIGTETGISKLNALWFSPNGQGLAINNKVLFEFTMQADAPISSLENLLQLSAATIPLKFYNTSGAEVSVTLKLKAVNLAGMQGGGNTERANADLQLKNANVIPNPFGGVIDFAFELAADAPVVIQIFNIDGRMMAEQRKYLSRGQQEIQISGLDHCPPGIYSYSIVSEGMMHRGKLVKK